MRSKGVAWSLQCLDHNYTCSFWRIGENDLISRSREAQVADALMGRRKAREGSIGILVRKGGNYPSATMIMTKRGWKEVVVNLKGKHIIKREDIK
jgi:hypothetical protein